jgi:protein-L-isoaspartate(D-aspartate) O-methyltransferase
MTDFTQARKNMVDCQIATMGVVDPRVLDVMGSIPREAFVAPGMQDKAYTDDDLLLGQGAFLMEPLTFARLVQAAMPQQDDKVLIVGDKTGYAAAVLGRLARQIVVAESFPGQWQGMTELWEGLGVNNVVPAPGNAFEGCPQQAPFSIVFIYGAVAGIPDALQNQLAPDGRLVTVLRKSEQRDGRAVLVTKLHNGAPSSRILFDAATPFIEDLAPRKAFVL